MESEKWFTEYYPNHIKKYDNKQIHRMIVSKEKEIKDGERTLEILEKELKSRRKERKCKFCDVTTNLIWIELDSTDPENFHYTCKEHFDQAFRDRRLP